ncbi:sulfite oxidase [Salinisphaera hydrothermalis]|uniref:Sulfite oxidase n=1 Tax=Salinisphaera hydrothermalis (strain C41B8) TaxID=1304275 RepID=A0A084IMZ0_SALHC|nr:sulfite oxidase [Salinisphaera hydrothermalis]KEZ78074.1 sulfite oxidase [Salinisphaera hydrothermalis C41B8]
MPRCPDLIKPTPDRLFTTPAHGERRNAETRLAELSGYLTPTDRFYVRNHDATPHIERDDWRLEITGDGVERSITLDYAALSELPRVSRIRAIECAGNARRFFAERFGHEAGGAQWHTGAIGVAEWSGVRLRDVLDLAGVTGHAVDVLPEGLDAGRFARPLPIAKAMADDTLVALAMNGEPLPPDHGFPARLVVSGWLGAASVKWLGRIEVACSPRHTHWNTADYTLAGPRWPVEPPADGVPVTVMPVMSVVELDWPARLAAGRQVIRGRAFSGEARVARVEYTIDDSPWRDADLGEPNIAAAWVCWSFAWTATPGEHMIRVRATDEHGQCQPDAVPWNDHGVLFNAVVAHPVIVAP